MAISIRNLKGLPDELDAELQAQGINNSDQLLEAARTPAGRKSLAETRRRHCKGAVHAPP